MPNRPEEMHRRTEACPGLKQPSVTSFFKVMFGDQFSEVLFLPPKLAPDMLSLVDQEVTLQDSSGKQWEVTVTNVEGSLAFQQGWDTFSLDHDLKVGDFVVFKYKRRSHFVVGIYNESRCEKLNFPKRKNLRKRIRDSKDSSSKDGQFPMGHESLMSKQSSRNSDMPGTDLEISKDLPKMNGTEEIQTSTHNISARFVSNRSGPAFKAEHFEETCYVLNRLGDKQGQEGRSAFDLSIFEMSAIDRRDDGTIKATVKAERFPDHVDPSPLSKDDAGLINPDIGITKQVTNRAVPSDPFNFEVSEKDHSPEDMHKKPSYSDKDCYPEFTSGHLLRTSAVNSKENAGNISQVSTGVINKCEVAKRSGTMMQTIKKEPMDNMESNACRQKTIKEISGEFSNGTEVTKNHNSSLVGISSPSPSSISCLVAKSSQSFLKLPVSLPLSSSRKRSFKIEHEIIFLRDPVLRLWPVLYHETPRFNILAAGWKPFSTANNIRQGDECTFEVENESEGIYRVSLIQR